MRKIHTHYDNLNVARHASIEVIRAAYKTLAQKYHPDKNVGGPQANATMRVINESYDVLSDPIRRLEHDKWIEMQEEIALNEEKTRTQHQQSSYSKDDRNLKSRDSST